MKITVTAYEGDFNSPATIEVEYVSTSGQVRRLSVPMPDDFFKWTHRDPQEYIFADGTFTARMQDDVIHWKDGEHGEHCGAYDCITRSTYGDILPTDMLVHLLDTWKPE